MSNISNLFITILVFFKCDIPGLFFSLFSSFQYSWQSDIKVCLWLDSNRGPLASEATALPTEPQPLPLNIFCCCLIILRRRRHFVWTLKRYQSIWTQIVDRWKYYFWNPPFRRLQHIVVPRQSNRWQIFKKVHPEFHWLNSFATVLSKLHWQLFSIGHCIIIWRGFTKGVSVGVI